MTGKALHGEHKHKRFAFGRTMKGRGTGGAMPSWFDRFTMKGQSRLQKLDTIVPFEERLAAAPVSCLWH